MVRETVCTEKMVFCVCLYFFDLKTPLYFMPRAFSSSKRAYSGIKRALMDCILMDLGEKRKETEIKAFHRQHCVQVSCSFPRVSHPQQKQTPTPSCRAWSCSLWFDHGRHPMGSVHPESTGRSPHLFPLVGTSVSYFWM